MHLILQKLDFSKDYSAEDLQAFVDGLVMKNFIKPNEAESINLRKIQDFLQADLCNRIKEAKRVEKEKAFCINIPIEEYENQKIAVQGIIDLYFIDKNDKLVLVDYKTDVVKDENVLKERYLSQLEIYQKALEISLNRKVDEMYIYSIYLNKSITF